MVYLAVPWIVVDIQSFFFHPDFFCPNICQLKTAESPNKILSFFPLSPYSPCSPNSLICSEQKNHEDIISTVGEEEKIDVEMFIASKSHVQVFVGLSKQILFNNNKKKLTKMFSLKVSGAAGDMLCSIRFNSSRI